MIVRGHVESGQIVLDNEAQLPEGAQLKIEVIVPSELKSSESTGTRFDRMKQFAGIIKDLPPDFAENHDLYIPGPPRNEPSGTRGVL